MPLRRSRIPNPPEWMPGLAINRCLASAPFIELAEPGPRFGKTSITGDLPSPQYCGLTPPRQGSAAQDLDEVGPTPIGARYPMVSTLGQPKRVNLGRIGQLTLVVRPSTSDLANEGHHGRPHPSSVGPTSGRSRRTIAVNLQSYFGICETVWADTSVQ